MKQIPHKIFAIVLVMGLICITGMIVLKYNIDRLSTTYHDIMDEQVIIQDHMKSIMTMLYQHQSQVMDHVMSNSEESYEKYEEAEVKFRKEIGDELAEFGQLMQGDERERLYHKVYSNYYGYLNNVDLVLDLSRNGDKNMAFYFVNSSLANFLDEVDRNLGELDRLTVAEMTEAKLYMNHLIAFSQISELICIAAIFVAVVVCLSYSVKLTTNLAVAKEEAEIQKQIADAANKSKSLFLAKMSHEIRTPINAIIGMNEMILREGEQEEIREYGMEVRQSAYILLSTINDILDLSKIESGKMQLVPVEYDFSAFLHDVVNMVAIKAHDKGLEFNLSLDRKLPSALYGDDVRLRQILLNLLNNAVKYTEQGSVTFSVRGEIAGDRVTLSFEVKDTGIGIKQEDLEKLFVEFERIEEKRNRNIEGTGLGMSITVQLLSLMGSRLQVESTYGEGSRFYFSLSQRVVDARPMGNLEDHLKAQAAEYRYSTTYIAPDVRILLVDDNLANRKVFVNLLKGHRMTIDEATGGLECLKRLEEQTYDLVFLDHLMPDLDGVETMRRIQSQGLARKTPVIALTANALHGAKESYLKEGFANYLSKPFEPEKLEEMLLEYIPSQKLQQVEDSQETNAQKKNPVRDFAEEGFPVIRGMDWKYAAVSHRDAETLLATIDIFRQLLESEAALLEQFYRQIQEGGDGESWKQYRVKVHSMKSSALLIGAVSLGGLALLLEDAATAQDQETIERMTPLFLKEWRSYQERLLCLFPEESAEKQLLSLDIPFVEELLDKLCSCMEEYDIDTADAVLEQLNAFEWPVESVGYLRQLEVAVLNLNYEEVIALTKHIREGMKARADR